MNRTKYYSLSIVLLTLVVALVIGCNTAPQPPATQAPAVAKIAYVGDNTCKQCHPESFETVPHTSHYQTFKPLADYTLDKPLTPITIFDAQNTEKPTSTTLDLSKDKVYGVMVNKYVIAEMPAQAGFKDKIYRVGALKKVGEKWTVEPAKAADIDKDGKPDWTAESFPCGKCHAPGIANASPNVGMSCESCHGPGAAHASAADKKTTMTNETARESCLNCHQSDPSKDAKTGVFIANTHYGTRNYFASKHAQSSQLNGCQACHDPHKANTNGAGILADKPADMCAACHAGKNFDLDKLMWTNPTDDRGHFTKDHSFGAMKYENLGDDPATKPIEITNPTMIDLIKKLLPELAK